jgi:hypothetical protein
MTLESLQCCVGYVVALLYQDIVIDTKTFMLLVVVDT